MNLFRPSKSPPPLDLPRKLTLPSGELFNYCSLKHFSNRGSYRSHARYIYFYEIGHFGPPSFYEKQGHTVVGYGFIGDIYWDLAADPARLFIRHKDKWVHWESALQPPTHPIFLDRCLWGTTDSSLDPQGRFGFGWFRLDTLQSRGIILVNFPHHFSLLAKDITKAFCNRGGQSARFRADTQTERWVSWSFSEEAEDEKNLAVSGPGPLPVKNRPLSSERDNISSSRVSDLSKQVKYYENLWIDAERGRKELEIRLRNERVARIQDLKMHEELLMDQSIHYKEEITAQYETFKKIAHELEQKVTNAEQAWKELAVFFPGATRK